MAAAALRRVVVAAGLVVLDAVLVLLLGVGVAVGVVVDRRVGRVGVEHDLRRVALGLHVGEVGVAEAREGVVADGQDAL